MKTVCSIFGLLFTLIVCGQKTKVDPNGFNVFYFADGKKSSEGNFKNGKPEGYWKTYFESGALKTEGNRKNHLLDSLWKFYREDGALEQMIEFREGKRNGFTYSYTEEGLLKSKEPFVDDSLSGTGIFYYPEDQIVKFEKPYTGGKLDGVGYEYAKDGRIISIITYEKGFLKEKEAINRKDPVGQKEGLWVEFYKDEKEKIKRLEGRYRNNLKNGYFREYDRKGLLLTATKYVNGKVIENAEELQSVEIEREFHNNAKVKWEKTYLGGQPHGIWKEFNDTGLVVNSRIYQRGKLLGEGIINSSGVKEGPWKEYYTDGKLRAEGEYRDGARYGKWKFYHQNGKMEQTGKYVSGGKPHGLWVWYFPNGEVLREENFRKGKEDGDIVEYDTAGNVIIKGQYIDGLEDGKWYMQIGEYREEGEFIDGLRHGEWIHYYTTNGKVSFKGKFLEGEPDGKHVYYYDSGKKMLEGKYEFGLKQGDWRRYATDGLLILTIKYKDGYDSKIGGRKVKPSQEDVENSWETTAPQEEEN